MNQPTTPNTDDFLPLPEPTRFALWTGGYSYVYTAEQVHAAILADRAQRSPTVAGSVDVDELSNFIRTINGNNRMGAGALAENIVEWIKAGTAPAASSEIEAAIDLPEKPGPERMSSDQSYLGYTTDTLTTYATEAVLKDRAARKGQ